MSTPAESPIPSGQLYRTLCDVEVLVYDYDRMPVQVEVLPAGSLFQPWEPLEQWQGVRVPITLGGEATGFDWGVTSGEGHFLRWEDFFTRCGPDEAPQPS